MGKAVVPDLPYVQPDVPDDSEAPENSGRFAGLVRGRSFWPRSASMDTTEHRLTQGARRGALRLRRGLLVGLAVSVASSAGVAEASPGGATLGTTAVGTGVASFSVIAQATRSKQLRAHPTIL